MNLINENYDPIPNSDDAINHHFWEYDVKDKDFYLKYKPSWQSIRTMGFEIMVDKGSTFIPSNFFVMIADVTGGLDWIKVDEIVTRPFEALVLTSDFQQDTWQILPINVVNVETMEFAFPYSKNAIPIDIGYNKAIMTSQIDLYSKMSSYGFTDIV